MQVCRCLPGSEIALLFYGQKLKIINISTVHIKAICPLIVICYYESVKQFISLPKLNPGDQVAVISPSSGLPGVFPWVQDLGLERLKNVFMLHPVEYPTTRDVSASLSDRARDIMAAFADKKNKAVFASIGGSDQIQLLKLLNPQVFIDNPKPFFGYSDNTHLHNFLWNLGIPSYYGGSVMTQLAMQGAMDDMTEQSIRTALFENETISLEASTKYNDIGLTWSDKSNLTKTRVYEDNEGWLWDGKSNGSGALWGGCVESFVALMAANQFIPTSNDLQDAVLILETAEDIPEHWIFEYVLIGMGERGWLDLFQAIMVGRPKAWEYNKQYTSEEKQAYKKEQQATVLQTIRKYNSSIPIIQNMDFGHTDPQTIVPLGRQANINSDTKSIVFEY